MSQQNDPMIGRQISRYRVVLQDRPGGMGQSIKRKRQSRGSGLRSRYCCRSLAVVPMPSSASLQRPKPLVSSSMHRLSASLNMARHPMAMPTFAMEFLDGKSCARAKTKVLRRQCHRSGAADGICARRHHARRTVHRDLKPENVMLIEDSAAPGGFAQRFWTLGLRRFAGWECAHRRQRSHENRNPDWDSMYMSPEQCRASAPPDERPMCTRLESCSTSCCMANPFVSDSAGELFALQMFGNPPRLKGAGSRSQTLLMSLYTGCSTNNRATVPAWQS